VIENQEKVEYPFLGILFYLDRRIGGEVGLFFLFQEVEERGSKSVFLAERFPVFGGGEIFGILAGIADDVHSHLLDADHAHEQGRQNSHPGGLNAVAAHRQRGEVDVAVITPRGFTWVYRKSWHSAQQGGS